jgi:hypothetical protein
MASPSSEFLSGTLKTAEASPLPHHFNVVPIRKVLSDLVIEHPIHVNVLNLERGTCGWHAHEHSTIDGKV